jgi:hypothetical protein
MKRKIFSKLLMGAFLIASVSMFVSCKDYDDDITKNSKDIDALRTELNSLKSGLASDLSAAKAELAAAIDKKANQSDLDKKANNDDLVKLESRVAALESQIKAIDDCATSDDLEQLAGTVATLQGNLDDATKALGDEIAAAKAAAEEQAKIQNDALKALEDKLGSLNYLTDADKKELEGKIEDLKKEVDGITISEDIEAMKKQFNELESDLISKVNDQISVLSVLVNKKLTSLVLIPDFYWEGIEGIEVPFLNTPEFAELGKPYDFKYTVAGSTKGDDTIRVHVDNIMGWLCTDGTILSSESDLTWNPALYKSKPSNTASGDMTYYSLIDMDGDKRATVEKKAVQYILISPGAEANYHINPGAADLEGYTYDYYENLAGVYTRSADGPIEATVKRNSAGEYLVERNGGILTVPFKVNTSKLWNLFYTWAFKANTTAYYQSHDANAHNNTYSKSYSSWYRGREPQWDSESDYYTRIYQTWVVDSVKKDADGNVTEEFGHYEFSDSYTNDRNVSNFGSTNHNDDKGNWVNEEARLPFISLEASKDTTVNSDYAIVVPAIYNIVALADSCPETALSKNTFVNNHTGANQSIWGQIRNNHLYETVGVDGTYDYIGEGAYYTFNTPGAIPSPATHSVVYNDKIDLKPFIETHFSYTTYTRYGQSTVDKKMDETTMKKLGLSYEFKKIDYTVGKNVTSESAHIEEGEEGVFYPRSVTEDGETILGEVATKEVIDREPLIRVDLIHTDAEGNKHIVRYGYIKLRIVESEVSDIDVEFELGDVYMNCGGYAKLTWSQVEAGILRKLNDNKGMSKQDFEKNYRYLDEWEHWNMPVNDNGALFETASKNHFWGQRFYKKDGKVVAAADAADENNAVNTFKYTEWTADNNWFGRVWYTPHDNATSRHNWDEQTNVLIWDLHGYDSRMTTKDSTLFDAVAAAADGFAYWRGNMRGVNGINSDALYQKLISVAEASYESKGLNKKAISTIVRFVNKNTGNVVNVKLTIPVGKLHFEWGDVSNKDWSHWFAFDYGEYEGWDNSWSKEGVEDTIKPYWREFDAHMNPFKPSNNGYRYLDVTSYNQMLTDNWLDPTKMVVLRGDAGKFDKFDGTKALGADPTVSFVFVTPKEGVNSLHSANDNGEWTIQGESGTMWTVALRDHKNITIPGNTAIVAIKKNGQDYPAEEIVYIADTLKKGDVAIACNNHIFYHGLENDAALYPAATDLLNREGAYDERGVEQFDLGGGLTNLLNAPYLGDDFEKTFTAYLKLEVAHGLCYEPLIGKNLFNARFHRPINVIGKEYQWDDRVLADNRLAIKDLVEIVDWNRFAVVAAGSNKIAEKNTYAGIEQPKYTDVYLNATSMKQTNLGMPYEYYGISELAVLYQQIRTDHAKQPAVRASKYYREDEIRANTDLVMDLNSLTSWRETGLKTLSLINADGTVVPFDQKWAYNHSDLNATGNGTNFGWLYYNNNASNVQEFHIYVPIAVKYNWGNISHDYLLDPAGNKLDKNYTQTVWAIITVKGTH